MTQNVDRETVVSRLLGTDDILILCHKNPDGDTIGSSAALCKALQHLGKTTAVLCSDPIPAMYDYMQITVYDGSFTPAFVVAVDVLVSSCSATTITSRITPSMSTCASITTAPTAATPTKRWWTTTRLQPPSC